MLSVPAQDHLVQARTKLTTFVNDFEGEPEVDALEVLQAALQAYVHLEIADFVRPKHLIEALETAFVFEKNVFFQEKTLS